jgi:hypothetical protein
MKHLITLGVLALATPALAEAPQITNVEATQSGGTWRFNVTLLHPDTGWDHYADAWEVIDQNGTTIGTRTLLHPHEHEQPFTRSLTGITLPEGTTSLRIRAHCLVDGWSEPSDAIDVN